MLHNVKFLSTLVLIFASTLAWAQQAPIQYFRYYDQRGILMFSKLPKKTQWSMMD